VELNEIVERFVSLLPEVDEGMTRDDVPVTKKGQGFSYIPSAGSANENVFVRKLMEHWARNYPNELPEIVVEKASRDCPEGCLEVPYVEDTYRWVSRADIALTTNTFSGGQGTEWLIEVKKFETVGDSGGKHPGQEAAIAKLLSPWPMSHGILYDVERICTHPVGMRKAVIMYGFSFERTVVEFARNHPRNQEQMVADRDCNRAENLQAILNGNNNIPINFLPLLDDFERACEVRGFNLDLPRVHVPFPRLTTHPIFIQGDFVAWEVLCPSEGE